MAFGGNCPQCALPHYACQDLLSSKIIIPIHNFYRNTSSGPMSLPQSLFVWKKQATRYLGLSQTLSGEMSPNSAFCWLAYHKLYGNSIILLQNPSSGYFSPKGRSKYFDRKIYFLDKMHLDKGTYRYV